MSFNFEFFDHPADTGIEAIASSKEELFKGALKGMAFILKPDLDKTKTKETLKEKIEVLSSDFDTLIADFLNEVLAKSEINKGIFKEANIEKLTNNYIKAEIFGEKIDSLAKEIKAVTYHNLKIFQDKDGNWRARIIFDI
ncbi:MAG: archease [Candidatus Paceibacterota bacterium]